MPLQFVPGSDTKRDFRDALGCFGTGVTVITVHTPNGPLGMTVNSFASVSLDPPLVLWSVAKASKRLAPYLASARFGVHLLAADQEQVALHFSTNGDGFDKFGWSPNADDVPILNTCLAVFDCATEARHDAGDHIIIVGRVLHVKRHQGRGLAFHQGCYGGFEPPKT